MRYPAGHKNKAHEKILQAVGRGFRLKGFGGAGVDGLAKEAGLTSGAFYGHFKSKGQAFLEAVVAGMEDFRHNVEGFQQRGGPGWFRDLADYYMGRGHIEDLQNSCALPSLSPEVLHTGDDEVKRAYEVELVTLRDQVAAGLATDRGDTNERAWALLAMLSGGVTMARAVDDQHLSEEIADAIHRAALHLFAEASEAKQQ